MIDTLDIKTLDIKTLENNMKTFYEFTVEKNVSPLVDQVAKLIVETNVDPWLFLEHYYRSEPQIVMGLIESHNALEEGWWDAAKAGASALFNGAKKTLAPAAQAFAKGVNDTAGGVRQAMFGPVQKYNTALQDITALSQELNNNQMVQQKMQDDPQGYKKLVHDLQGIAEQLKQQQKYVQDKLAVQQQQQQVRGGGLQMGQNASQQQPQPVPNTMPQQQTA